MQHALRHSVIGGLRFGSNNIFDIMKAYTATIDLTGGADTPQTTTILSTKSIYSIEYIDSTGIVITIGLGQPVISTSGGFYVITVYSTDTLTDVVLRVIYK